MEGDILKGEFLNGSEKVADKWNARNRTASGSVKKKGENRKKGYMREKTARKNLIRRLFSEKTEVLRSHF